MIKKNKSEFIIAFLKITFDISKGVVQAFARESWHYKDLRIGGFDPQIIYGRVNNLKRRGILRSDGQGRFVFTKEGINWARESVPKYFPVRFRKWDRRWRIVIFDIPQELHRNRVALGRKLKNLGFYMLQKSVFVFPHPCEEELGYIGGELEISDYIDIITAENAGFKEKEIRAHFNI